MNSGEHRLPAWMPEEDTVTAVSAGQYWDAVVVPQHIGIAVMAVLDTRTGRQPGPVIWDVDRHPRLYFLVPAESVLDLQEGVPVRHLGAGGHVAVPGPTKLLPPGPYWLAPPDPDEPGRLVDAELLARAIRHVRGAAWVEWEPSGGQLQQILVNSKQLNGRACVLCGAGDLDLDLVTAGYVYLLLGGGRLGYPVKTCCSHGPVSPVSEACRAVRS